MVAKKSDIVHPNKIFRYKALKWVRSISAAEGQERVKGFYCCTCSDRESWNFDIFSRVNIVAPVNLLPFRPGRSLLIHNSFLLHIFSWSLSPLPFPICLFFKQSMGARNRVGIGLSYRPARRLCGLAELILWNRFSGSPWNPPISPFPLLFQYPSFLSSPHDPQNYLILFLTLILYVQMHFR